MTIAYRDREAASGNILSGNNLSVSLPGLTEDDDLMVAIVHRDAAGSDLSATTFPAGWTKLSALCVGTTSGRDRVIDIGWKVASSETGPYLFTNNGNQTDEMQCLILAYSGVDTTTPIDVTPTASHYWFEENVDNSTNPLASPAIDPQTSPTMALIFCTLSNATASDTSVAAPSGYSAKYGNQTSHDIREWAFIGAAEKALSDTSTETPGDWVFSGYVAGTDEGYSATIVLREASAAAGMPEHHGANRGIIRGVARGVG